MVFAISSRVLAALSLSLAASSCSALSIVRTLDGTQKSVSAEFPFESKFVTVHGSQMHYIDEGRGPTFLLLHGNPTSVYLWRNIIPHLKTHGRVVAVDLIGMGRSDRPSLGYGFFDHYRYIVGFIQELGLRDITLVIHDWGSALGFAYAARNENNVVGIAFFEAITRPTRWSEKSFFSRYILRTLRDERDGYKLAVKDNFFIDSVMQLLTGRDLSSKELAAYGSPYVEESARKPLRVWPTQLPIDGKPADVHDEVLAYSRWLERTAVPKLLLWASDGIVIGKSEVERLQKRLSNLTVGYVGAGRHYLQEDQPDKIGEAIASWFEASVRR